MKTELQRAAPADSLEAETRRDTAFAKVRQHANPLRRILVEADDVTKRAIETDFSKAIHNVDLDDLEGRFNFLFQLCALDNEIEHMLDAAYMYILDALECEHATVCGIVFGLTLTIIGALLAKLPDPFDRSTPHSAAEIRAKIAAVFPASIRASFGLDLEKQAWAGHDAADGTEIPPLKSEHDVGVDGDVPSWTREEIAIAEIWHLEQAFGFGTEFMQMLNLRRFDDEIDGCISPATRAFVDCMESGKFTPCGSFIMAMRKVVNNHRAFKPYLPGPQAPYPRASKVILAEIDNRMPDALRYLRDELEMALEEERAAELASQKPQPIDIRNTMNGHPGDGYIDDKDVADADGDES